MKRPLILIGLVAILASLLTTTPATARRSAEPNKEHPGTWQVVANCSGINPIHSAVLENGKVLMVAGSGYNRTNELMKVYDAWVWDPATPSTCPKKLLLPVDEDIFCAGMSHLPNGQILFFGGTGRYGEQGSYAGSSDYYTGIKAAWIFDTASEQFVKIASMNAARWYGNGPVNAVGNPVVIGGLDENAIFTKIVEYYHAYTGKWTQLPTPGWEFPMYAGMVLLAGGYFAYTGTYFVTNRTLQPMTWNWTNNSTWPIPGLSNQDLRDQALTLLAYPYVRVIGGGGTRNGVKGVTGTTGLLDISKSSTSLSFVDGPHLGWAAMHQCGQVLPDRSYFVSGGTNNNIDPRLRASRLTVAGTAWQTLSEPSVARGYHSSCVLLPNGKIITFGSNWNDGTVETRIEVYTPWYGQAEAVPYGRPKISTLSDTTPANGQEVYYTNTVSTIKQISLTRLSSNTHSTDPNQREVTFSATPNEVCCGGKFTVPSRGVIPPGPYMLSLVDWRGVPSESWIIETYDPTVGQMSNTAPGVTKARKAASQSSGGAPHAACCCC